MSFAVGVGCDIEQLAATIASELAEQPPESPAEVRPTPDAMDKAKDAQAPEEPVARPRRKRRAG